MKNIILHVDVNSAYLSWSALWDLQHGSETDLRKVPSIVGGDPENRHGIVLAKSMPAKKYGIVTGESLYSALVKCPHLVIVPPRFSVYLKASNALVDILEEYSSLLERFSIDECFLDLGRISRTDALIIAKNISRRIHEELGFTVNIGISNNKLLAKMASDFKKPNGIHTLYPEEIESKMWPLPIGDLYMVGPKMASKLKNMNITTIGKLASLSKDFLTENFMKYGLMLYAFSHGIDESPVHREGEIEAKGVGNSTTLPYDLVDRDSCLKTILSLLETLIPRLKNTGKKTGCLKVHFTTSKFLTRSRQRVLIKPTDSLKEIYDMAVILFDEFWDGSPLRKIGLSVTNLISQDVEQLSFWDFEKNKEYNDENKSPKNSNIRNSKKVDETLFKLRKKFGKDALIRATFINSPIASHEGGVDEDDYIIMGTKV